MPAPSAIACHNSSLPSSVNSVSMPRVNSIPALFAGTTALFCLAACSLSQRLDMASERVEQMYAQTQSWEALPLRTVTWQQACDLMRRNNTDLHQARNKIEETEREALSVYTDMIPGVSYYGYLTSSIDRLSETVGGDNTLNSNVNVNFYLPALTQVPYRVYSAKVQAFAAIKALEGKERELISQLYRTTRLRQLNQRKEALDEAPQDEASAMKRAYEKRSADSQHWDAMARLLGDASARWEILPQSLPRVRWSQYSSRLRKLDPLVVCNFAMKLEQARMAQYGVALQYLPTLNLSLYSPSLFSSSGGTYSGTFLSGEDTKLNFSLSYTLDTQLRIWHSYQRNKEQYELACRTVAQELREHKSKMDTLRRSFEEYENWRSFMNKRIHFTENMTPANAEQLIAREKDLISMKQELLTQETAAVESEAVLVLEYGLPES